jgi:dethiobiotin synthetase
MKAVFVIGTDTGVGKTLIAGLLGRFLLNKDFRVITQKWIQTGTGSFSSDVDTHLRLMKIRKEDLGNCRPFLSPYVFKFASSPHLAARLEKKSIRTDRIKRSFKSLSKNFDIVIVEGTGGALVPFGKRKLIIDIAAELNLPVLIVVGNRLGAINHALLTVEAVRRRKMKIIGLVFNNNHGTTNRTVLADNPEIIKALTKESILGVMPWSKNVNLLYRKFIPVGKQVIFALKRSC